MKQDDSLLDTSKSSSQEYYLPTSLNFPALLGYVATRNGFEWILDSKLPCMQMQFFSMRVFLYSV